jgi:hypothetical protein
VYSRVTDTILKAISQFLFWGGVLWLGTFERGRLNQLRNMSLKEYLSKNGAKKQTNNEPGILIFENHLFSSLSFVLLAVAIGNHYFFQARFRENLPLLITALLFIIYNMGRKRG